MHNNTLHSWKLLEILFWNREGNEFPKYSDCLCVWTHFSNYSCGCHNYIFSWMVSSCTFCYTIRVTHMHARMYTHVHTVLLWRHLSMHTPKSFTHSIVHVQYVYVCVCACVYVCACVSVCVYVFTLMSSCQWWLTNSYGQPIQ